MQYSLMQAILNYLIDNRNEFNLHNATTKQFRPYIYDDQGEYLIGGEQVSQFISDAIKLINKGGTR